MISVGQLYNSCDAAVKSAMLLLTTSKQRAILDLMAERKDHSELYRLAKAGLSVAEIARRIGISRQRVHQILNEPDERKVTDKTKALVHRRYGGFCAACHIEVDKNGNGEYHHIVSRRRGGTHDADNLILLCPPCHRKLHVKLRGLDPTRLVKQRGRRVNVYVPIDLAELWDQRPPGTPTMSKIVQDAMRRALRRAGKPAAHGSAARKAAGRNWHPGSAEDSDGS